MSYYEIYNDRIFDLFEAPEKRTTTGLALREAGGGKTVVVGLSEMPCGSLKEFESLYDKANANRSTSATKLNAHSSRSHAILCVKLTVTTPTEVRVSTASAIDLAGSEDNRRTGNEKERMIESASINKSLFVLAQCVEAISKKQQRIPYRESKMTRILSLGQNNGFTVMILNLAPVRAYHLDTLSSLNFANRTKKIEVREVENEPIFKGPARPLAATTAPDIQRQPLRPLTASLNLNLGSRIVQQKADGKPVKSFSVYSDPARAQSSCAKSQRKSSLKREGEALASSRPSKTPNRPTSASYLRQPPAQGAALSKATIEQLVEEKVSAILATKAEQATSTSAANKDASLPRSQASTSGISEEVQHRLASIEQRLAGQEGARAEGLSFLLMAKQHQARGEDLSALKMYRLARPYFPGNAKLEAKIKALDGKVEARRHRMEKERLVDSTRNEGDFQLTWEDGKGRGAEDKRNQVEIHHHSNHYDDSYHDDQITDDQTSDSDADASYTHSKIKSRSRAPNRVRVTPINQSSTPSPRTRHLLSVINSRDVQHIKGLKGVGPKRAEGIVESLVETEAGPILSLQQLGGLRGVGRKTVEGMRQGISMLEDTT